MLKGVTDGKRWGATHAPPLDGTVRRPLMFAEIDADISIRVANMDAGFSAVGNVPEKRKPPLVVGHVMEDSELAWVIMRMTILVGDYSAHEYRVAPMTPDQPGYSLLRRRDCAGMSRQLQANSR